MKHLIWIFPLFFLDFNFAIANEELNSDDSTKIIQQQIQEEENESEDLVVDRDRDNDRGRDERRNLYEYNQDTLRHEAEEKAWKARNYNRTYNPPFPGEL